MGDLEKRVAILEQELEVLKSQIQATLLDIQEQLLTNYYPHLRLEDGNVRDAPAHKPPPIQSVSVNDESSKPEKQAEKAPIIRLVNSNEVPRDKPPDVASSAIVDTGESDIVTEAEALIHKVSEYEDWAVLKLEKLGLKRTTKLIKVYAKQGHFSPSLAKHLLTFVMLFNENDTITPMGRSDRNRSLVLRLIAGLSGQGSTGERKHG